MDQKVLFCIFFVFLILTVQDSEESRGGRSRRRRRRRRRRRSGLEKETIPEMVKSLRNKNAPLMPDRQEYKNDYDSFYVDEAE